MATDDTTPTPGALAFRELRPGAVRPLGWLADQLGLQARGLTGALEECWPDVGPSSAWLGGGGEDWERGPYYLDGLIPLAHATADPGLLAKSQRWVDAILASQRTGGAFGPETNDDEWPRAVALKALIQHADATDDERVAPFVAAYLRSYRDRLAAAPPSFWGRARGFEAVLAIAWLFQRTGEAWLIDLAATVFDSGVDWPRFFLDFPIRDVTRVPDDVYAHGVNIAMAIKAPALRYLMSGGPEERDVVDVGLRHLDRYHGQVHGMFSGDEYLAGREPTRGVETCTVVEMMFSLEQLLRIWGDPEHADRLEGLAYNLLPAAANADVTAHQYVQQANQVLVSVTQREWTGGAFDDATIFGLEPNFGCCTANFHQGWPKLLRSFWLETPDGGLAAVVHGPSSLRWETAGGTLEIDAVTAYPFADSIRYEVRAAPGSELPLSWRVPSWCTDPGLRVNGEDVVVAPEAGYLRLVRRWAPGDVVELSLPARPRLVPRGDGVAGMRLGALVLAHSGGEIWERIPDSAGFGDWEVRPRRTWAAALALDEDALAECRIERSEISSVPFGLRPGAPLLGVVEGVPLKVWTPAILGTPWPVVRGSAASPSEALSEVNPGAWAGRLPLVPYGSARIRIAEFPNVGPRPSPPG